MHEHYVALGLARVRSAWFRDLSRWSTAGQLPVDFVKCVSIDEVRARLASGRALSALIIDGGLPTLDRDLIDLVRDQGCAVIVVDDGHDRSRWQHLGVSVVLSEPIDPRAVLAALVEHAKPVAAIGEAFDPLPTEATPTTWQGRLIAVTGSEGSGTSIVAMAVAQGLAADARMGGRVLLADCALHADLAMLHDARDVVPGIQELVEAHRIGRPTPEEVRSLTFECPDRGYDLLLGLRRHRDWAALRPRSFAAGLGSLTRTYSATVCDVDADLEGEDECGSIDVEERNLMARTVLGRADVVLATGRGTLVGLHRLVRVLDELRRFGVDEGRVLPVLVGAPRSPRARAELTRGLADLRGAMDASAAAPSPVFVSERRQLDAVLRGGDPLPRALVTPLAAATQAVLEHNRRRDDDAPRPVKPGTLGSWTPEGATG